MRPSSFRRQALLATRWVETNYATWPDWNSPSSPGHIYEAPNLSWNAAHFTRSFTRHPPGTASTSLDDSFTKVLRDQNFDINALKKTENSVIRHLIARISLRALETSSTHDFFHRRLLPAESWSYSLRPPHDIVQLSKVFLFHVLALLRFSRS